MESKVGQHFDLWTMNDIKSVKDEFPAYSIERKVAVEFLKQTEKFLLSSIVNRAIENGITDLYVIDEDFVMEAIKEKIEREKGEQDA